MKGMNPKRTLRTALLACGPIVATSALAQSQGGYGHGNGMMGGYGGGWMGGGIWLPVLLVIMVAGLVVWIVAQKKK